VILNFSVQTPQYLNDLSIDGMFKVWTHALQKTPPQVRQCTLRSIVQLEIFSCFFVIVTFL
jgi:hypothetical protein